MAAGSRALNRLKKLSGDVVSLSWMTVGCLVAAGDCTAGLGAVDFGATAGGDTEFTGTLVTRLAGGLAVGGGVTGGAVTALGTGLTGTTG